MPVSSVLTVTTAATNRLLTSMATAQAIMGITEPEDVTALNALLPMVCAEVENYTNRVFARELLSETFLLWRDPPGRVARGDDDVLQLARFPVVAPAGSIVLTVTENGTTLTQNTDYIADYESGELRRLTTDGTPRRWQLGTIVVVYTAGYILPVAGTATRNLPPDIENATIKLLRRAWFSRQRDPMQTAHGEPGIGQTTYWIGATGGGMMPDVIDLLDNYRSPVVA